MMRSRGARVIRYAEIRRNPNKLFEINWKPIDDSSKLSGFKFTENKCGIKEEIMETFINKEPYDYMKLLITDDIINHIVLETNRYAAQSMEKEKKTKS
jgi:hypothetical protein